MTPRTGATMSPLEWALLLCLSLLWGASFLFVGVAVAELPPFTIATARVGLAAVTLWLVLAAFRVRMARSPEAWLAFGAMGLINNAIPFSLIVWGQTHIASGLASILVATTPLFTVVIAGAVLADERFTAGKALGVVSGFAGVILMIGPDALRGLGSDLLAQLAIVAAALSYACGGVYGRRFRRMDLAPLATATGQATASTAMLLPTALLVEQPWTLPAPGAATVGAVIGLAVLSTALAYILYFRILATAGATNLLLVTFLIPVSAILLGFLILGERLELEHFAGMGLIGLGLAAIDGRLLRLRPRGTAR